MCLAELGFKLGVEIFRAISREKGFIEIRDFMIYLKTHSNLELGFVLLKYLRKILFVFCKLHF